MKTIDNGILVHINVLNIFCNIDTAVDIVFLYTKWNDIWSFKAFIIFSNIVLQYLVQADITAYIPDPKLRLIF